MHHAPSPPWEQGPSQAGQLHHPHEVSLFLPAKKKKKKSLPRRGESRAAKRRRDAPSTSRQEGQLPRAWADPVATGIMVRNWGSEGPETLDHIPAPPEERAAQPGRLFLGPLATQPSFPRGPPVATGRASRGPLHASAAERPSQGHSSYRPGCCSFRPAQPPRVSVALRD